MTTTVTPPAAAPGSGGPGGAANGNGSGGPGSLPEAGAGAAHVKHHRPPLARVVSGKVFYGWYVALACSAMMLVTVGVSYYGLSLFLKPLSTEHGWSISVVTYATGFFLVFSGGAAFLAGPWIDRWGPRVFLGLGIVLTAVGAILIGFIQTIWQLYVAYGLLAIAYGLGAVVPVSTLVSRWFIHKRAKATMVSSTGVSVGGAVLVPIGAILIEKGGLRLAAPTLGLVVLCVALPVLFLVVAASPRDLGLEPDGGAAAPATSRIDAASQYRVWTRADAVRSFSFWAVVGAFFLALGSQTGVLMLQITFLSEPDKLGSRGAAALAVTTTTIGSILARIVVSTFADRLDKRFMASTLFVLQAAAVAGYLAVHSTAAVYAVALVFGFTVGNVYMAQSLLVGELFGLVSFGTVYGMASLTGQIGSGLAVIGLGPMIEHTGGYTVPFLMLAAFDLTAAVIVLGAVRPRAAVAADAPRLKVNPAWVVHLARTSPVASAGWAIGQGGATAPAASSRP